MRRLTTRLVALVAALAALAVVVAPAPPAAAQDATGVDGAWNIVWSGADLTEIDPGSGQLLPTDLANAANPDSVLVGELSALDLLQIDTSALAERAREQAEAKRRADDAKRSSGLGGGQTSIGPDGCPTGVPAGTMREGAEKLDPYELCARSVSEARTPEAAGAIKFALTHLGYAYSQPQRMQEGYFDCSSYVSRAYESAGAPLVSKYGGGWAPTTFTIIPAGWGIHIARSEGRAGDLLLPTDGHVAMLLADGWMAHTSRNGDVSHVKRAYTDPQWTIAVDPSKI